MQKNKKKEENRVLENVQYVIYCRKSRDEASGAQVQSIIDQLNACIHHAKAKGLPLMPSSTMMEEFVDGEHTRIVEGAKHNKYESEVIAEADGVFFITEQASASKDPKNRWKRHKLIKYIREGKINGILSLSPDRQARNLVDSGELIQMLCDQYLDVQYTNYTFENNPSGRMVLSINFSVAFNYSDNLSDKVSEGKKGTIARGKADGKYKRGYIINEQGFHAPDPDTFDHRKEAFRMKIYDLSTDEDITAYLNAHGATRKYKKDREESIVTSSSLYRVRVDEFYYGLYISGSNQSDLRDSNQYYKPMITDTEHQILLSRHIKNDPITLREKKTKEEFEQIMPFGNKFIQYESGHFLYFSFPNPKRAYKRLEKELMHNSKATLSDVVDLHQVAYTNTSLKLDGKSLEYKASDLTDYIYQYLKTRFRFDEKSYEAFSEYQKIQLKEHNIQKNEKRLKIQNQINNLSQAYDTYVNKSLGYMKSEKEQEVYNKECTKYESNLRQLNQELIKLGNESASLNLEISSFYELLGNIAEVYAKANTVRKRKITELLFSNILVNNKKELSLVPKLGLESLFISESRECETRTHDHTTPSRVFYPSELIPVNKL